MDHASLGRALLTAAGLPKTEAIDPVTSWTLALDILRSHGISGEQTEAALRRLVTAVEDDASEEDLAYCLASLVLRARPCNTCTVVLPDDEPHRTYHLIRPAGVDGLHCDQHR